MEGFWGRGFRGQLTAARLPFVVVEEKLSLSESLCKGGEPTPAAVHFSAWYVEGNMAQGGGGGVEWGLLRFCFVGVTIAVEHNGCSRAAGHKKNKHHE